MKKGINIWSFGGLTVREALTLAKKAGFEGVELGLNLTGEASIESSDQEWLDIKKFAEEIGIELYSLSCGLYWDFSLTADCDKERAKAEEILKKEIDIAALLGLESCLVIPGTVCADFVDPNKVVDYQTVYERSIDVLNRFKGYAEEKGVEIALENVWNKFLNSPIEMKDFIDKFDSEYIGSYFDVGNVVFNGYPEHWIKVLGKRIKKVHFKDYRRVAGGLHGFVDLLAGDVNYPAVVKALEEVGYDGPWLYEVGFDRPDTLVADRALNCEDFARNAKEIFGGKKPTAIATRKPDLEKWVEQF